MRSEPRLRHVAGAWLLARDHRESHALATQRLAHHQVAAHRTWGVAAGLAVIRFGGDPRVGPGCAVDRCGRLLVLPEMGWVPRVPAPPVHVVLSASGRGPLAHVCVRELGRLRDLDVPLARIDGLGQVHAGDGDRQWLRRPGPTVTLGGNVERGARADGTRSTWWHDVDLSRHRLAAAPVVAAAPGGAPPPPWRTTVEVTDVEATGFRVVVRHPASNTEDPVSDAIRTTPLALSWMAVLPADRTLIPPPEDW